MLDELRQAVCEANLDLVRHGLVFCTWGNASARDPETGLVVIKPSGVPYDRMRPDDMVVVDPAGSVVDGTLTPSSDTPTHVLLYSKMPKICAIVHTHSHFATVWAQASRPIPCLGTTHADYFHGEVPVTEPLTPEEVQSDYERNTGEVIVRRFAGIDPLACPAVLVAQHGPFAWGSDIAGAVESARVVEEVARMAFHTLAMNSACPPIPKHLLDKHFLRKHGADAYYGQSRDR